MVLFVTEWLNLLSRWGHLIAGIAWIGTSFYFIALDFCLKRVADPRLQGEAWEVHGGGFYHVRKYLGAPAALPRFLIWFKWEAYLTWVTGFLLLIFQYYINASALMVDPQILDLTGGQAIMISLVSLVVGWVIYDGLCRALALKAPKMLIALVFLLIALAAFFFTHVFSGRAAFLHLGAVMGTMMAANVFLVIIPNQRKITARLLAKEKPDKAWAMASKQRSLHNTYLTLPVLAMMISSHYGLLTSGPQAWLVALLIVVSGVAVRTALIRHEVGEPLYRSGWLLSVIILALAGALWLTNSGIFSLTWWNFLLRWGHLIAGIAWIGTSFYFVALDLSLRRREGLPHGVAGEAWEVHGGGFYQVQKYLVAPAQLPQNLIWFKWEAYLTWMSGFLLLIVQYYILAPAFLIDPSVNPLSTGQAIIFSLASLMAGWLVYDCLCRSGLSQRPKLLAFMVFVLIMVEAVVYFQLFSRRGAFIHVGVLMGTIMAANVFMVIIPNQRRITKALLAGLVPDPGLGLMGKQRSLHNTFLTLPVLVMMISNHYPMVLGALHPLLLVAVIVAGGAVLRVLLLKIELGRRPTSLTPIFLLVGALLLAAVILTLPRAGDKEAQGVVVSDVRVQEIINQRCVSCHGAKPTQDGFDAPPKGLSFDQLDQIKAHASQIKAQAVDSEVMPLGNITGMVQEERDELKAWITAHDDAH